MTKIGEKLFKIVQFVQFHNMAQNDLISIKIEHSQAKKNWIENWSQKDLNTKLCYNNFLEKYVRKICEKRTFVAYKSKNGSLFIQPVHPRFYIMMKERMSKISLRHQMTQKNYQKSVLKTKPNRSKIDSNSSKLD